MSQKKKSYTQPQYTKEEVIKKLSYLGFKADLDFEAALGLFQKFNKIKVTRKIDKQTLEVLF